MQCFAHYTLKCDKVQIEPTDPAAGTTDITMLMAALPLLAHIDAPGTLINLKGWKLTEETMSVIAAGMSTLPHLKFGLGFRGALTDTLMGALLTMPANVRAVEADHLELRTDAYVHAPWLWDSLTVELADATQLLRLPSPATGPPGCRIEFTRLSLLDVDWVSLRALLAHLLPLVCYTGMPARYTVNLLYAPAEMRCKTRSSTNMTAHTKHLVLAACGFLYYTGQQQACTQLAPEHTTVAL